MGAVHGVYLKYVGLSALSYAGYALVTSEAGDAAVLDLSLALANGVRFAGGGGPSAEGSSLLSSSSSLVSFLRALPSLAFIYSAVVNGSVAVMFQLRRGMGLLGKDPDTGRIPPWSYAVFFPFHIPNILYTHVHTRMGQYRKKKSVPVASEVQPGWWVGGCYAHELNRDWSGVIDLTVEFPERLADRTMSYMLLPTWDGVPPSPEQLEEAATFAVEARKKGDVIVHCAHGRGRSTTVMCACLIKAGLYDNWEDALEKGIRPGRPVCKLNSKMRKALTDWQREYVDGKKVK